MEKLRIAAASENPAKVRAVRDCLENLGLSAEVIAVKTDSGVSAQPFSLEETRQGALNRATSAVKGPFDLAVGLEGGVFELGDTLYLCNWGALVTAEGEVFTAAGAQIPLPEEIALELRKGFELGPVMDSYASETGIRLDKGAIGVLTAGLMNRGDMFGHIMSLLMGQYRLSCK